MTYQKALLESQELNVGSNKLAGTTDGRILRDEARSKTKGRRSGRSDYKPASISGKELYKSCCRQCGMLMLINAADGGHHVATLGNQRRCILGSHPANDTDRHGQ